MVRVHLIVTEMSHPIDPMTAYTCFAPDYLPYFHLLGTRQALHLVTSFPFPNQASRG
jgi:hypothetical protein